MPDMVSLKNRDCVERDQSHAVMSALALNTDWDAVPKDAGQAIISDPVGVGREFTRYLQNRGRMLVVTTDGIALPLGARMHIVAVLVDESRPWNDAVNGGGPNTPANYDIRKVGDQYPPIVGATPKMKVVYLINFGEENETMGDDNITWGKSQKLDPETPRTVFKIAEENPNLDETLGMKGCMSVVSLKECSFEGSRRAPSAWWSGTGRRAGLGFFGRVWHGYVWFAFSRESELGALDSVALRQQAEAK